jgi:hypothetical protein
MDIDEDQGTTRAAPRVVPILAAILGLALIGFGLWALAGAIFAAWQLYTDPDSIGYFARYFLETSKIAAHLDSGGQGLSHLAAWLAVILLLLVMGKLGSWSIAAGGALLGIAGRR